MTAAAPGAKAPANPEPPATTDLAEALAHAERAALLLVEAFKQPPRAAQRERADVLAFIFDTVSATFSPDAKLALAKLHARIKAGEHEGAAEAER